MVVSQTPLRISFAGGGTDFPAYYLERGGMVLSTAIDKYVYVVVKARYDDSIRVGYSQTENADSIDGLEHELVRESLRLTGVTSGVEVTTIADIPSAGSGLGSSSSVTVGLLNALHAFKGDAQPAEVLAEQACQIELDILGKPIGKQDQYIAAFGGMRQIEFGTDGEVHVNSLYAKRVTDQLNQELLLFHTGQGRQSADILAEQDSRTRDNGDYLDGIKALALEAASVLRDGGPRPLGDILHRNWQLKKRLASTISTPTIDDMYARARAAGATGGKICGAGGGGHLLLYCPPERREAVKAALRDYRQLSFRLEPQGTRILLNTGPD